MDLNLIILPVLNTILGMVGAAVLAGIIKYAPVVGDFLEEKLGNEQATALEKEAWKIWYSIEENSRLGDFIGSKFKAFEKAIQGKFPGITDAEIFEINKAVAGEFNKDKTQVMAATADAAQTVANVAVVIQPKFVAPDGTELVPAPQV
jgi:hypothetical protein